ncbi:MAG: signal peptide peptidase SppA [Candidatus Cloacimonetes bacterium 4572_55]|nr:MAG: signal peptide peptidase SppA [Candidatus Cloacimonetes bacterium 4572_55]
MKKWLLLIGFIGILVIISIIIAGLAVRGMIGSDPVKISSDSILNLDLGGYYPEVSEDDVSDAILSKEAITHRRLELMFDTAKTDGRIKELYIDMSDFGGMGWARAKEIRNWILNFKTSGKPVTVYMDFVGDRTYYVATAADKIVMPPEGGLLVNGIALQMFFLKGSFDKIGIEWEEFHAGKYKSAPETLTRENMSQVNREAKTLLINDIFDELVSAIAEARGMTESTVKEIIDNGPYLVIDEALEAGLIDQINYESDLLEKIGGEDDEYETVSGKDYMRECEFPSSGKKFALIFAVGEIVSGDGTSGQFVGSKSMTRWIREAAEDEETKAILIRVDSPGGSALASDIIWREIIQAREKKPIVVSMGDLAASGGYYISAPANYIFAEPTTITGSIGVFGIRPVMGNLFKMIGANTETILKGKNSNLFDSSKLMSPEQRSIVEKSINQTYDTFLERVSEGRSMDYDDVHAVAQGRVWTGNQALERGLVDDIGDLTAAVEKAKELAEIDNDQQVWLDVYPRKKDLFEILREKDFPFASTKKYGMLPKELQKAAEIYHWQKLYRPEEPLARLPYIITAE